MRPDRQRPLKVRSSEATRRRLLDAALEAFGEFGFDSVRTRDLANKSGVNQASIPYYFGGKEGLYLAVVEELIGAVKSSVGETAGRIEKCLNGGPISYEEGKELIAELVEAMVRFLMGPGKARFRAAFVIRELMHPSKAFDRLYDGYMRQVHTAVTRLVAALLGEDPDTQTSILRTHALLGQIILFSSGRELIRRRAHWDALNEDHLKQITEVVTETFLASIRAMRAERGLAKT